MAGSINPWPLVQSGSNGHPSRHCNFSCGPVGTASPSTASLARTPRPRSKAFQSGNSLAANGIVDAAPWPRLSSR